MNSIQHCIMSMNLGYMKDSILDSGRGKRWKQIDLSVTLAGNYALLLLIYQPHQINAPVLSVLTVIFL